MQEKNAADRTSDAHRADKLYMESNLLRIAGALFCHDQKVVGKRTAEIELNAEVIEKHITNYAPEKKRPPKRGREGHSLSCTCPENARRKFAACEALLAAVKIALSSCLRREIHEAMYSAWRSSPRIPR